MERWSCSIRRDVYCGLNEGSLPSTNIFACWDGSLCNVNQTTDVFCDACRFGYNSPWTFNSGYFNDNTHCPYYYGSRYLALVFQYGCCSSYPCARPAYKCFGVCVTVYNPQSFTLCMYNCITYNYNVGQACCSLITTVGSGCTCTFTYYIPGCACCNSDVTYHYLLGKCNTETYLPCYAFAIRCLAFDPILGVN